MVVEVALGQVFILELHFLSVSSHQFATLIFIYMLLLPEGQTGEAWEPSEESGDLSEFGERWIEKHLSMCIAFRELNDVICSSLFQWPLWHSLEYMMTTMMMMIIIVMTDEMRLELKS
jgi:hypothetical protein